MRRNLHEWVTPPRAIAIGIVMAALCVLFQSGPTLVAQMAGQTVPVQQISSGHWTLDVGGAANGAYYLSLGRPRGLCDLSIDGNVVDSTRGALGGLRGSMLLGAPLRVDSDNPPPLVRVDCEAEEGFPPSLSHSPVLASPRVGVLLQFVRAASELIVGPVACLLLMLGLTLLSTTASITHQTGIIRAHWLFAFVSIGYALSLAHYPRVFMSGLPASTLHIVLRFSWSLSFSSRVDLVAGARLSLVA